MDYADIIARIVAAINDDEVAAITGPVGNGILNDMVAELGEGYQFAGILTPTSNPVRTDARLWALAMTPGKYYNLDGRVLADGQVAVFMWGGGWSSVVLSVTTAETVRELLSQFMDATTADAEVDLKADELTPVMPPMVTGSARGLLGRSAAARFLYRQTTSGSGAAWLRSIHGRTVSYNQLCDKWDFTDSSTTADWLSNGPTKAYEDNSMKLTGSAINQSVYRRLSNTVAGHKYLCLYTMKASAIGKCGCGYGGTYKVDAWDVGTSWNTYGYILTANGTNKECYIYCSLNNGRIVYVRYVNIIDLTQAGLDSIITTPEQFEAWQMEQFGHTGYLGYTPGTLVNVNPTGVLTTGRNVWDEEWENGKIGIDSYNLGIPVPDDECVRSKNPIPLNGGGTYYAAMLGVSALRFVYYDASLSAISSPPSRETTNTAFTPPADAAYARFYFRSAADPVYHNEICINISDPTFNGQYEPYNGHTLPLDFTEHFPTGMNGVDGIYDEVVSDENGKFTDGGKRFGKVDLGTLTWTKLANKNVFRASLSDAKPAVNNYAKANVICPNYYTDATGFVEANIDGIGINTGKLITVGDDRYTDPADFKAAMSGVPLVFELATPQHVAFTDPSDAVYPVTEGGTEQVLPVNGSEPTAIAPDFQMQAPLRRGYDTPTDATFDNFLEALGQHLGKTIAKEWDAETQTYQFDIL